MVSVSTYFSINFCIGGRGGCAAETMWLNLFPKKKETLCKGENNGSSTQWNRLDIQPEKKALFVK